jgi:multiple sugar transport system ATP-binding protein
MAEPVATEQRGDAEATSRAEGFVQLNDLTKVYSDGDSSVIAVEDLDISIGEGEFVVFVGPSGCGKTTTLRCIAGLEDITEGSLIIDGENVKNKAARERGIAMVFQTYALYPHMTVRENMEYPLKVRGYSDEEKEERVNEAAEMLQIPELLDRKPADLSGGQQQRVALGRALVREPKVFLLDEPLSNLDQKLRVRMRTELNKLHNKLDMTSVYVTHDQAEAMTLGDRIAVMDGGELQQIAPPQTIYNKPANQFVAGFIGEPEMNFFDGTLDPEREVVETSIATFELTETMRGNLDYRGSGRTDVVFGIRPEHITLTELRAAENIVERGETSAEVRVVEELGSNKHLTLDKDGVEYRAVVDEEGAAERGTEAHLVFNMQKSHLFDAQNGRNLLYSDETL